MIAKISTGGSFSSETNYEMKNKKNKSHKFDKKQEDENKQTQINSADRNKVETANKSISKSKRNSSEFENKNTEIYDNKSSKSEKNILPFKEGERHRMVATNIVAETPQEYARFLKAVAEQNPNISKPAVKISISADKRDSVSSEQWQEIGKTTLKEMGYEYSPYFIVQHRDREHDHIHIVTSRVNFFGETVSDSNDKPKLEALMRQTEEKYNFQRTESSRDTQRSALTRAEIERFNTTGEIPLKLKLQVKVDKAIEESKTVPEFIEALNKKKVSILSHIKNDNEATGISFYLDGEKPMSGSSLGNGFKWESLQKRGLVYQPSEDLQLLKDSTAKCEEQMRSCEKPSENLLIEQPNQIFGNDKEFSDDLVNENSDSETDFFAFLRDRYSRSIADYDYEKSIRDFEFLQSQKKEFEENVIQPAQENAEKQVQNLYQTSVNIPDNQSNPLNQYESFYFNNSQDNKPLETLQNITKSLYSDLPESSFEESGNSLEKLSSLVENYFAVEPEEDVTEDFEKEEENIDEQNEQDYPDEYDDLEDAEYYEEELEIGGMSI